MSASVVLAKEGKTRKTSVFAGIIRTFTNPSTLSLWNALDERDKTLAYYLYRSALCGQRVVEYQFFRGISSFLDALEAVMASGVVAGPLLDDMRSWYGYLTVNAGPHLAGTEQNSWRGPQQLGLKSLTPEVVRITFIAAGVPFDEDLLMSLTSELFVQSFHRKTDESLELSSTNFWDPRITDEMVRDGALVSKLGINTRWTLGGDSKEGKREPVLQVYATEALNSVPGTIDVLKVHVHWLKKALAHVQEHPEHFPEQWPTLLSALALYHMTGDEIFFEKYNRAWTLLRDSPVDFAGTFVEYYDEPFNTVATFQADVTLMNVSLKPHSDLLLRMEKALPIAHPRKVMALPNASVRTPLVKTGRLGPSVSTIAYALPNDPVLRSELGSKQTMYDSMSMGKSNIKTFRSFFLPKDLADWYNTHDPDGSMTDKLWDVHVALHETVGHGSGSTIQNVTKQSLGNLGNAIEEMRADINALHLTLEFTQELLDSGLFGEDWKKHPPELVRQRVVQSAVNGACVRWRRLSETDGVVRGAHCQAATSILTAMRNTGAVTLVVSPSQVEGHEVVEVRVSDLTLARTTAHDLCREVNRIRSEGDVKAAEALITKKVKTSFVKTITSNFSALRKGVRQSVEIFPVPVMDTDTGLVTLSDPPDNLVDQCILTRRLALSTE